MTTTAATGQCTKELRATDSIYTAKTQFRITVLSDEPNIDSSNATCDNWLEYTYLDNEDPGVYFLSFYDCFLPTTTSFKFNGTYSDGSQLNF